MESLFTDIYLILFNDAINFNLLTIRVLMIGPEKDVELSPASHRPINK